MMKFYLTFIFLFLIGCGKESNYVYHSNPPERKFFSNTISIQEIDSRNKIDILWVIDNSGSMSSIQNNIVNNAELFMREFIKSNYIDWKMGLISTDKNESPYLGFGTPFDRLTMDPVNVFKRAVNDLGIDGSASEYVFHNIDRVMQPPFVFLRPSSHLAVIMVTDEVEQSAEIDATRYEVNNFFNLVRGMIHSRFKVRFYGAFSAKDLENCVSWGMAYDKSPFQSIIGLSNGFEMSACNPDFGEGLSKIGKDIASLLEYPRILLSERPRVKTIKVQYQGNELSPGRPEQGGYWYYDDEFNMIVFYNLNFSQNFEFDSVDVSFEINDGEIRLE